MAGSAVKYIKSIFAAIIISLLCASCSVMAASENEAESISFVENLRVMRVGEEISVALRVSPSGAKADVSYSVSGEGVIEINAAASSRSGAVVRALAEGSAVLIAKTGNLTDFCNITVSGFGADQIPFITVSQHVLEVQEGGRRNIIANLQNAGPAENAGFAWLNENQETALMETANNVAVIEGARRGSSRVRVSHPRAQYSVEVLVFVVGSNESARYITGTQNVVFIQENEVVEYYVQLVNAPQSELGRNLWEVFEGRDSASVTPSGASARITGLAPGIAQIRVFNQAVDYPFEFTVVVSGSKEINYIDVNENFIKLRPGELFQLTANTSGAPPEAALSAYSFTNSNPEAVFVTQSQNVFSVEGVSAGQAMLEIHNDYSGFPREVLVMVESHTVTDWRKYITTSQNVIYMEAGQSDYELRMQLAGGVEADRNGFEWVVSDYGVLEAASGFGTVRYRSAVDLNDRFNASAFLTAKAAGTAVIEVLHEKAEFPVDVLVKVFPKGTFSSQRSMVSGPGLIRARAGHQTQVNLQMLSGQAQDAAGALWETDNAAAASAFGAGLNGAVEGVAKGQAKLRVSGGHIAEPFESLVIVSAEGEYEDELQFMYVDRTSHRMPLGGTIAVPVFHPNTELQNLRIEIENYNYDKVYAVLARNVLVINAVGEGAASILIRPRNDSPITNDITVTVNVEGPDVNFDRPYTLEGPAFIGAVAGQTVEYRAQLSGAPAGKESGVVWGIEDSAVAEVTGNGLTGMIRAISAGQTDMRIQHLQANNNPKRVVVYVVENASELENRVAIGADRLNYAMRPQESIFIRLNTNANDLQKQDFMWGVSDTGIVYLQPGFDTAVITAMNEGTVKITVSHPLQILPLDIWVTVRDGAVNRRDIGLPSSVSAVAGESRVVRPDYSGLSDYDISQVVWGAADESVVELQRSGGNIILTALKAGVTTVTASSAAHNIYRSVLFVAADTQEELDSVSWISFEGGIKRIKIGEELALQLTFGGFPLSEEEKEDIVWSNAAGNGTVSIAAQGGGARVTGVNPGTAVIRASGPKLLRPAEMSVEVSPGAGGQEGYFISARTWLQLQTGQVEDMAVTVYNAQDGQEVPFPQGFSAEVEEGADRINILLIGNTLRVQALSEGGARIKLRCEGAADHTVAVVVGEGQFVFIERAHYLVDVGQKQFIWANVTKDDEDSMNLLTWGVQPPGIVDLQENVGGARNAAEFTALSAGNAQITVSVSGAVQETVYVSVRGGSWDQSYTVSTESIIGVVTGERVTTSVMVGGNTSNGFFWRSEDTDVATVAGGNRNALVTGVSAGDTFILVGDGSAARTIAVFVRDTREELDDIIALNIDNRSYRIRPQEVLRISPYYRFSRPDENAKAELRFNNRVASVREDNGVIEIEGLNEGVEVVRVWNPQALNSVDLVVEVDGQAQGGELLINRAFMTTDNNVLLMDVDEVDARVSVRVIGEYQGTLEDFIWSADNDTVSVQAFGTDALVSAKGAAGDTRITVSNRFTDNDIVINAVIGEKTVEVEGEKPYIWTERTVYSAFWEEGTVSVPFMLHNFEGFNNIADNLHITISGESAYFRSFDVNPITAGNLGFIHFDINGMGVTEAVISHAEAPLARKIFIVVTGVGEGGAAFLTTSQNHVVVRRGGSETVQVRLSGAVDLNMDNIKWDSDDSAVAYTVGGGYVVQIHGAAAGMTNIWAQYNGEKGVGRLKITVRVVEDTSGEQFAYLTTADNVIETYAGSNNIRVEVMKVGGLNFGSQTTWASDDPGVASVLGSGFSAFVEARGEGITRIRVTDSEAGTLEIIVLVRKAVEGGAYVVIENPVEIMTPRSQARTLRAGLMGEDIVDGSGFHWRVVSQYPSDIDTAIAGGSVIGMHYGGNEAAVTPLNAGRATLRVSHDKANEFRNIEILVTEHMYLSFRQNDMEMELGGHEFITVNVPEYESFIDRLEISSTNPEVAAVTVVGRHVLISAKSRGIAYINASVRNTDMRESMQIRVVDADPDRADIVVSRTVLALEPFTPVQTLSAYITGRGVTVSDSDNLMWELEGEAADALMLWPFSGRGREMMLEPRAGYQWGNKPVYGYITVRDGNYPQKTNVEKGILVYVSPPNNFFTLDKYEIKDLRPQDSESVTATIAGASNAEYNNIIWYVEQDIHNPGREIARLEGGSGRNVSVRGSTDGKTRLVGIYNGIVRAVDIEVRSPYLFRINYQFVRMYPGEMIEVPAAEGGYTLGFYRIPFTVRPSDEWVTFIKNEPVPENPIINFNVHRPPQTWAIDRGFGHETGYIEVEALREGNNVSIHGNINPQPGLTIGSTVHIDVSYSYSAGFNPNRLENIRPGSPPRRVEYRVFPPNSFIRLKNRELAESMGIGVNIGNPIRFSENAGEIGQGYIDIDFNKEVYDRSRSDRYYSLLFEQYVIENGQINVINPPLGTEGGIELRVRALYNNEEQRIVPVFNVVEGAFSNRPKNPAWLGEWDDNNDFNTRSTNDIRGIPYINGVITSTGDGGGGYYQNYFPSRRHGDDQNRLFIERRLPLGYPMSGRSVKVANNTGFKEATAFFMPMVDRNVNPDNNNSNMTEGDSHTYNLTVTDGEEHYILFDKIFEESDIEILSIDYGNINSNTGSQNRGPSFETIFDGENNITGMRVSGGNDFVLYSNAGTLYDIEVELSADKYMMTKEGEIRENIIEHEDYIFRNRMFNSVNEFMQAAGYVNENGGNVHQIVAFYNWAQNGHTSCYSEDSWGKIYIEHVKHTTVVQNRDLQTFTFGTSSNQFGPRGIAYYNTNSIDYYRNHQYYDGWSWPWNGRNTTGHRCNVDLVSRGAWYVIIDGEKVYPNFDLLKCNKVEFYGPDTIIEAEYLSGAADTIWRPLESDVNKRFVNKADNNDVNNVIRLETFVGGAWYDGNVTVAEYNYIRAFNVINGNVFRITNDRKFIHRGNLDNDLFSLFSYGKREMGAYGFRYNIGHVGMLNIYRGTFDYWLVEENRNVNILLNRYIIGPMLHDNYRRTPHEDYDGTRTYDSPVRRVTNLNGNNTVFSHFKEGMLPIGRSDYAYIEYNTLRTGTGLAENQEYIEHPMYMQSSEIYLNIKARGFVRNENYNNTSNENRMFNIVDFTLLRRNPFRFNFLQSYYNQFYREDHYKDLFDFKTIRFGDEDFIISHKNGERYSQSEINSDPAFRDRDYIFFPVATRNYSVLRNDRVGQITVRYMTPRGEKRLYFNVYYEVRGTFASYEPFENNIEYNNLLSFKDERLIAMDENEIGKLGIVLWYDGIGYDSYIASLGLKMNYYDPRMHNNVYHHSYRYENEKYLINGGY